MKIILLEKGSSIENKIQLMLNSKINGTTPLYPKDQNFLAISFEDKVHLIKNLQPEGGWKIQINTIISDDPYFEKIETIKFFQ
jgi:hypothetical protein